jgi:hypothetical protein
MGVKVSGFGARVAQTQSAESSVPQGAGPACGSESTMNSQSGALCYLWVSSLNFPSTAGCKRPVNPTELRPRMLNYSANKP